MRTLPAAAALAFSLGACGGETSLPCKEKEAACAVQALRVHRGKQLPAWKDAFARPIEQRIGPAPPFLVELVALDNIANAYPNRPRAAAPDAAFLEDVRLAVAGMPESVRKPLAAKLAGIYFIEDLGSTGFADKINDASGRPMGGFIVLDPGVLRSHTANSWFTWRDGTPFKPHPAYRLEGVLAEPGRDDRRGAIQYILLHEIAHVLAIGANLHPDWDLKPAQVKSPGDFPWFQLSWTAGGERYATPFDAAFPRRKDIVYYFGAKIPGEEMIEVYDALEKTNFPTLYGATSPGDDFAEAFASYVHTVVMGKPFEIRLLRDARVVKRYQACWNEPRCAEKRRMIEALLGTR